MTVYHKNSKNRNRWALVNSADLDQTAFICLRQSERSDKKALRSSSKTSRGKKDSTKIRHQRHHQRQPGEQLFPIQVVTG